MPHNPGFSLTLTEVAEVCGGQIVGNAVERAIEGVSTDTRQLAPGDLFIALEGRVHDGHGFLAQAEDAGAVAAVVSQIEAVPNGLTAVVVDDTLEALGRIGAVHRSCITAKIGAITGSTGKTTSKDMLGSIMGGVGPTIVSEGTENNEIGVPLTLLRLTRQHRFCVLELAMRGPGEIAYLAEIARPEVGAITNIGQSHVGRLGSREAIAQAKAELLEHLPAEGAAVLNADDFFFSVLTAMAPCPVVSFGFSPQAEFRAEEVDESRLNGVSFRLETPEGAMQVEMQVPGRHNALNAVGAAALAHCMGANLAQIVEGLERYEGSAMRMQRVSGPHGSILINDAYNASPDSVNAALQVLGSASCERAIFVFGDMLEMGPEAESAHREVGTAAVEAGVDRLVTIGELARLAAERAREAGVSVDSVSDADEVPELLEDELGPGDLVLVKGSRGMRLERIVEALSDDS